MFFKELCSLKDCVSKPLLSVFLKLFLFFFKGLGFLNKSYWLWLFVPKFSNANIGVILKFILATPDLKVSSSLVDILFTSCILPLTDWKKFLIAESAVTVTSGRCGCVLLWDEAPLKIQSNVCGSVNEGL